MLHVSQSKTLMFAVLFALSTHAHAEPDPYSQDGLRKSVNALAVRLPMQVDAITTISGVALLNNRAIQYRYSLDKQRIIELAADEAKLSIEEFRRVAKSQYGSIDNLLSEWSKTVLAKRIVSSNCSTPDTKAWLSHGVKLVHTIYDNGGVFLHEETVSRSKCQ